MKISFKYCIAVLFALIYSKAWTQPTIGFGHSGNTLGCAPLTILFNINGVSGNPANTTYVLDFGDGTPEINYTQATLPSTVSHTYTQISCGEVINGNQNAFGATLTATNASGTTIGTVTPIRISKKPNAAFNVSPSIICSGGSITFTNTSETGVTYTGNTCNTNPPFYWQVTGPSAGSVTSGSLGTNNGFANNIAAWTAGTSSLTMQFITPGSYQMKLAIGNSCGIDDTTLSFCVVAPPAPVFAVNPNAGCVPPNLAVSATNSTLVQANACFATTYAYTWSVAPSSGWTFSGVNTATTTNSGFSFNAAGNYTVTLNASVNDLPGCSASTTQSVNITAAPVVNAGANISICAGAASVQLNGTPSGGTWSGTGVTLSGVFTPSTVGTFTLTYTIETGNCAVTDDKVITVLPLPNVNAGPDITLCNISIPYSLTGYSPAGGTWSGQGVTPEGVFTPFGGGQLILTYYATQNGCTVSDQRIINVGPIVNAEIDQNVMCAGSSTTLTAIVSGGTAPYTYNWSPNGSLSSINGATAIAQPSVSTTYELTVTDANGCIANDSASITVVPLPLVNAGPDISLCYANSGTALSGFSPAGGTWSGTGVSASGQFTPSTLGTNTLTYSVTQNNCTATDEIMVEVIALPDVNAGPDLFLCSSGIPFTLTGGLPAGGNWSGIYVNNNVISTNINATGILTYTYTENGCIGTDQISVSISDTLNVQAGNDFEMCIGDSIQLNGSPAGGYWAGAEGLNASGLFVPLNQQVVLLSYVISNTNCPTAADVMVLVADTPSVTFNLPGAVFCTADTDVPLSGGLPEGGTYSGEAIANNRMNPSLLNPGNYVVAYDYTAASGCTARDTALIRIEACTGMSPSNSTPFFRVFPNPGKGLFHIEVAELNAPAQLFVYNSSGVLVSTKNMDKRSTILDMSLQAPGIYFMRIEANGSFVAQQKMLVLE